MSIYLKLKIKNKYNHRLHSGPRKQRGSGEPDGDAPLRAASPARVERDRSPAFVAGCFGLI